MHKINVRFSNAKANSIFRFVAYVQEIKDALFNTELETLVATFKKHEKDVPQPLCSKFDTRLTREEAIAKWQTRKSSNVMLFPAGKLLFICTYVFSECILKGYIYIYTGCPKKRVRCLSGYCEGAINAIFLSSRYLNGRDLSLGFGTEFE